MRLRRSAWAAVAMSAFVAVGCTTAITVRVGDDTWTAACLNVSATDCDGIVRMFLNNLARNYGWVHDESGATIQVSVPSACPAPAEWDYAELAQPGACWRASAPVRSSRACMIMARRITPLQGFTFVRIGGDELTGSFAAPRPGTTPC